MHSVQEHERVKETILTKMKELGISGYAARTFPCILENQPVSATTLCKLTGIPDSKIYYALKELEEKNLIIVQHGTPSLYRALDVKQVTSNLEAQLAREYQSKVEKLRNLAKLLEPLSVRGSGEAVELAYIIKGFRNIVEKMKDIVIEARREIVLMVTDEALLLGLSGALKEARVRGVDVRLAVTENLYESPALKTMKSYRTLLCECNILIADSDRLVTASGSESRESYAIITQDNTMITMSKSYYDNPSCCAATRTSPPGVGTTHI